MRYKVETGMGGEFLTLPQLSPFGLHPDKPRLASLLASLVVRLATLNPKP
jgi:hypothetical protein